MLYIKADLQISWQVCGVRVLGTLKFLVAHPANFKHALRLQEFEKYCLLPLHRLITHTAPQVLSTCTQPALFLFPSQLCICHTKPLKTHATCFIASDK